MSDTAGSIYLILCIADLAKYIHTCLWTLVIIHYVFSYSIEEASTSSFSMRRRAVVRVRVGLSAAGYPL